MNLIPLPHREGTFLGIQEFFPIFQSENAGIVLAEATANPGPWSIRRILDLPFVHRIEVLQTGGSAFLIAAALCGGKAFQDDWSQPGAVYAGAIPEESGKTWSLDPVLKGINKNHGLCTTQMLGRPIVLACGAEGLFALWPPEQNDVSWTSERWLDHEISDLAVSDLDHDGREEIVTIEPFHGDRLCIYKKEETGWQKSLEETIAFGHALWAGLLLGRPMVVYGNRGGAKDLGLLDPVTGQRQILDEDVGPAQVAVFSDSGRSLILSANHAIGEVALYELTAWIEKPWSPGEQV
jgi:hypothetical protein